MNTRDLCAIHENEYMHGKHSWEVKGQSNQEVVVAQLLDSEVVEYVRNRKDNQ